MGFGCKHIESLATKPHRLKPAPLGLPIYELGSLIFLNQPQLAILCIERESPQLGGLRRKLREHRAARRRTAWTRRCKRRRIGKYRDAQRQRTERPQRVQRMAERHGRIAVAHVFIEVQVRQRRHNQRVGGKCFDEARHAHQQFGQLKTGERPRHADALVEFRRGNSPLPRQARNQQRIKPVRAIQAQHPLPFAQQARQKIMEQPRRLRPPIKHRKACRRQHPGPSRQRRQRHRRGKCGGNRVRSHNTFRGPG